jgi:RimJ/RimL family protein N-acetyltransferase
MVKLHNGSTIIRNLKENAGVSTSRMAITIGKPIVALLRPVATHPDLIDREDVSNLTNWRNRFVKSFLTEFHATDDRTASWLTDVVRFNDSKILFMLEDLQGKTFGYMGLDFINWQTGYGEADAIVRGGYAPSGMMKTSLKSMIDWAISYLGLVEIGVRVRSDNSALSFYEKTGFTEVKRVQLRAFHDCNTCLWIEDDKASQLNCNSTSLVYMKYSLIHNQNKGEI